MADVTRLKLLDAALALLAAPTPPAISTRALADRAEVNLSLISYHFGGRELLLSSAQSYAALRLADEIRQAAHINQTIEQNAGLESLLRARLPLLRAALSAGCPDGNAQSRERILAALAAALPETLPEAERERTARGILAGAVYAAFVDDRDDVAPAVAAAPERAAPKRPAKPAAVGPEVGARDIEAETEPIRVRRRDDFID
jgi:AcrR family transcriptional regulator